MEDLKSIRGRSQDAILAACLYIACRQEDKPRTFKGQYNFHADLKWPNNHRGISFDVKVVPCYKTLELDFSTGNTAISFDAEVVPCYKSLELDFSSRLLLNFLANECGHFRRMLSVLYIRFWRT